MRGHRRQHGAWVRGHQPGCSQSSFDSLPSRCCEDNSTRHPHSPLPSALNSFDGLSLELIGRQLFPTGHQVHRTKGTVLEPESSLPFVEMLLSFNTCPSQMHPSALYLSRLTPPIGFHEIRECVMISHGDSNHGAQLTSVLPRRLAAAAAAPGRGRD